MFVNDKLLFIIVCVVVWFSFAGSLTDYAINFYKRYKEGRRP